MSILGQKILYLQTSWERRRERSLINQITKEKMNKSDYERENVKGTILTFGRSSCRSCTSEPTFSNWAR